MDYLVRYLFFFFNDTATTEIYTLSLPDALPISKVKPQLNQPGPKLALDILVLLNADDRSEEHTSELQSLIDIVCRLLLEKTKGSLMRNCTTAKFARISATSRIR